MGKKIELTGKRFGFWIVLQNGGKTKNGHTQWLCQCECGNQKLVTTNSLRTGNSTSCGCNHAPNLIGETFEYLTVESKGASKNKGRRFWHCKCKCGNIVSVSTYHLRNKIITSCGCKADPIFTECHTANCVCITSTIEKEDFPAPNGFYSPQHIMQLVNNNQKLHDF